MSTTLLAIMIATVAAIPDGSILVLQNSNKPVATVTGSDVTHVAIVFRQDGTEWVYEATPAKARRIPLAEYRRELSKSSVDGTRLPGVSVREPNYPYSELQIERMRQHAASQLGRRYSIKGYVRGEEFDGIHCAHLVAGTLAASGRHQFKEAYAMSPGELMATISPTYQSPVSLPSVLSPAESSWCEQSWATWFGYGNWCRWACYETWTFCW